MRIRLHLFGANWHPFELIQLIGAQTGHADMASTAHLKLTSLMLLEVER